MIKKSQHDKPYRKGLIGKFAKVKTGTQTFEGKIIVETKNTLTILTQKGEKKILKKNAELIINNQKIKGEKITKRTEERIKLR